MFQAGELVLLGHRIMNTLLLVATAGLLVWEAHSFERSIRNVVSGMHVDVSPWTEEDQAIDAVFAGKVLAVYRDELEIQKINQSRQDASCCTMPGVNTSGNAMYCIPGMREFARCSLWLFRVYLRKWLPER